MTDKINSTILYNQQLTKHSFHKGVIIIDLLSVTD